MIIKKRLSFYSPFLSSLLIVLGFACVVFCVVALGLFEVVGFVEDVVLVVVVFAAGFFAFGVSIDAFSTGLGLSAITNTKIVAMTIFSLISFAFTWFGLLVGKKAREKLGKKANIFGLILLVYLGIHHLVN